MSNLNLEGLNDSQKRLFAVRCARRVQHLMKDPRSIAALDVAELHALGQATDEELNKAMGAARDAADCAAYPEWNAAWAAAYAAGDAVWAARLARAWAESAVARAAGWRAWGAATAAEREAQRKLLEEVRGMTR